MVEVSWDNTIDQSGSSVEMITAIRIALILAFLGLLFVGQVLRNRVSSADLKSRLRANNVLFLFLEMSVMPGVAAIMIGSEKASGELLLLMVGVFSLALGVGYAFCQLMIYVEDWLTKRKQHQ